MHEANIYTLLMAIRGFSNEITVRALSDKLGISYSTLARCKNGVWPRSVTLGAMRDVLEECRERFFDGDGTAMAEAILLYFRSQDVATDSYEKTLAESGYEEFVSELLLKTSSPQPATKAKAKSETSAEVELAKETATADNPEPEEAEPKAEAAPETVPEPKPTAEATEPPTQATANPVLHDALIMVPLAIVLLVGMLNVSLASLLEWVAQNHGLCVVILMVIAFAPLLTGVLVDSPIAWHAYAKSHPHATVNRHDFAKVAKFGSTKRVVPRAGRYNLTSTYVLYQPTCNVLGVLCSVSLLVFLDTLPEYLDLFSHHNWTEFLKIGIVIAYFIAYGHAQEQLRRPALTAPGPEPCENPDNYLPTRVHVWANTVHLTCVLSLLIVLMLSLLAYGAVHFRSMEAPLLVIWPYLQCVCFFLYANASPAAVRLRSTSVGGLVPGVVAASVGLALVIVACYLPSWHTAVICALCLVCSLATMRWASHAHKVTPDWIGSNRRSSAYSLAVAGVVAALFVIGLVTSMFA